MVPIKQGLLFTVLFSVGCFSGGNELVGLAETEDSGGPRVRWELLTDEDPEIPFPNDIATRVDSHSATGLRFNPPQIGATKLERRIRKEMAKLDGFGNFSPLWIQFEPNNPADKTAGRLNIETILATQTGDAQFNDDVILVLDVTKSSPTFGQAHILDFGNGNYPITLGRFKGFYKNDSRDGIDNLLFETVDEDVDGDGRLDVWEDLNQNGTLDSGEDLDGDGHLDENEDTDGDGILDVPNLIGSMTGDKTRLDPYADMVTFYEWESNTLIFRPLTPFEDATTYAVVIFKDLVGQNGKPVVSPFDYVHHLKQTDVLAPVFKDGLLEQYGRTSSDVAFAWTFTTQDPTKTLKELREGLYGIGPFAELSQAYPSEIDSLVNVDSESDKPFILSGERVVSAVRMMLGNTIFGQDAGDNPGIDTILETYGAVDYIVAGNFTSPDLITAGGGTFKADSTTGEVEHQGNSIRFLLSIPKSEFGTAPFPLALYCHGHTSMKLEALLFAGILAKYGIATFVIDSYAHGLPLGGEFEPLIQALIAELEVEGLASLFDAISYDRAKDLNGDGIVDPAGDFFTYDIAHTRDAVRQTVVDYMQATRIFKSFDGNRQWQHDLNGDGLNNDLAGDFNGDGIVDVGGSVNDYVSLGMSMGGIMSSIIGGIEPSVRAVAPISPGGGVLDIGLRTNLGGVTDGVILPILGPMIVAEPLPTNPKLYNLEWLVSNLMDEARFPFARLGTNEGGVLKAELRAGDAIQVENLTNLEVSTMVLGSDMKVRIPIPADVGDSIRITLSRPTGEVYRVIENYDFEISFYFGRTYKVGAPLVSIAEGFGLRRNTPEFRKLLSYAQMLGESADPINYVRRYRDPIHVLPEGGTPTNALITLTMGDRAVPISTGVALGRSAGVIDYADIDPVYGVTQNQMLIDHHVTEGQAAYKYFEEDFCHYHQGDVNFDVDDLSNGRHQADLPRLGKIVRPPICENSDAPQTCFEVCETKPPLRATKMDEIGIRAVRFLALKAAGQHVLDIPNPELEFDPSIFSMNQVGHFLKSGGNHLSDAVCLADNDCRECVGDDCPDIPAPTTVDLD